MTFTFPSRGFRRTRERASGLLFAFGVDDLSPTLPSGQTLVFDRNSSRTVFDSAGRVVTLANDQLPWSATYNDVAGLWEPTLDAQRAATNLCLQSEDFSTTWAAVGTPTRTALARMCGVLGLDLIGDDAAGTLEGYTQTVGFTGNAVKSIALFMAAGTSTSTAVRLRDTTAAADRLLAVVTWSGGVPSVAMTTGTDLGKVTCANGVYRFIFQTTSVTAANTNSLQVYPATTSGLAVANTGTVYAGGVQAQNREWPNAYIKTTTATVTTVNDVTTAAMNWVPQDFTVFARLQRPPWIAAGGGNVAGIGGGSNNSPTWSLSLLSGAPAQVTALLHDGTTQVGASGNLGSETVVECCAQYATVATGGTVRLDVGSGFGSPSSATGPITAWNGATMAVAMQDAAGSTPLDGGLRRLIIAAGARTLAQMRGLAV
jgi:hypothetical protein